MANTVTAIQTEVLNKLDNQDLDSTTVISFINQAHREVLNKHRWSFMEVTATIPTVASTASYSLPTGAQQLSNLRITDPDANAIDLSDRYMDYREFDERHPDPEQDNEGIPDDWTVFGEQILLYPIPDAVYTLSARYLKSPTALTTGTDVSDIPEEFQEIVVLGAAARVLERDDAPDEAAVLRSQADILLQDMLLRYSQRQIGRPMKMRSGRNRTGWNNSGWRL